MLRIADKYADICYVPSRDVKEEDIQKSKRRVTKAAEKANRANKIAFVAGFIGSGQTKYEPKEYCKNVESAVEAEATYYLTSFPKNEEFIKSMRNFAKEIMPSFK